MSASATTDVGCHDGNPAGGHAHIKYTPEPARSHADVFWQDGPVNRDAGQEPNGAFVEDVMQICAERIAFYECSKFACAENAEALNHLLAAIGALKQRRADRAARGVQGKHKA